MLFYVALTLLIYFLSRLAEKKDDKKYVVVSLLVLIGVFSLRGRTVGTDLEDVLTYYENSNFQWTEWGYSLLAQTVRFSGSNTLLLFTLSLLIYCPLFLRLWEDRELGSYATSVLIFMLLFYNSTLNIMRQWIAVSFVLFGTRYLKNGVYWKFLATNILAMLFHTSAVIGLGFMAFDLVLNKRLSFKKKLISVVPVVISLVLLIRYYGDSVNSYLINRSTLYFSKTNGTVGLFNITMLLIITIVSAIYWSPRFFSRNAELKDQRFLFAYLNTFCGYLLIWLGYFYPNMERISYYYYVYQILLIGNLFKRIRISNQPVLTKNLCRAVILAPCIYYHIVSMLGNANGVIPYTLSTISEIKFLQ